MKKIILFALVVFVMTACTSKSATSDIQNHTDNKEQSPDNIHMTLIDTTHIERIYNDEEKCIDVSYDGEEWGNGYSISANYYIGEEDKQAHAFKVKVRIVHKGKIQVSRMELETENKKFSIAPTLTVPIDNIITLVYFSFVDKEMIDAMDNIAHTGSYIGAKVIYDSGSLTLPLKELQQIRYMARSYAKDGGKFE